MPKNLEKFRLARTSVGLLMAAGALLAANSGEIEAEPQKDESSINSYTDDDLFDKQEMVALSAAPAQLLKQPETTTTTAPPPPETTTTTTTVPPPPPEPKSVPVSGTAEDWMKAAQISPDDYDSVNFIMSNESGWDPGAVSAKGCIGLGQNCPDESGGYWLKEACPNWQGDPVCQLGRFATYAIGRYGSWEQAEAFWVANNYW